MYVIPKNAAGVQVNFSEYPPRVVNGCHHSNVVNARIKLRLGPTGGRTRPAPWRKAARPDASGRPLYARCRQSVPTDRRLELVAPVEHQDHAGAMGRLRSSPKAPHATEVSLPPLASARCRIYNKGSLWYGLPEPVHAKRNADRGSLVASGTVYLWQRGSAGPRPFHLPAARESPDCTWDWRFQAALQ